MVHQVLIIPRVPVIGTCFVSDSGEQLSVKYQ
jgi:hypothetical protein